MKVDAMTISQSKLVQDYLKQKEPIMDNFDYNPYRSETMTERLNDIKNTNYNRDQLVSVLMDLHKKWELNDEVELNINRLKNPNSVVVIGGQQAGLLTGPLYTIHKMISIIVFAQQQEKTLGVPVIPVFWIAGEDHDFPEINHIFLPEYKKMKKYPMHQKVNGKSSISHVEIDHQEAKKWLNEIFEQLQETVYTKTLYQQIIGHLDASSSFVDFFAKLTNDFFATQGLVLIDSGDSKVREIEVDFFKQLIIKQPEIAEGVYHKLQKVKQEGYSVSVDVTKMDGHLFYHKNGERIRLMKTVDDHWIGKNQECQFTTDELLAIANQTPEKLSNNVITRPLMQEYLFPTLAFFAGPGELGYWSILKPAFHALDYKMPPVLPRLSFTIIDRASEKKINNYQLEVEQLLEQGATKAKLSWLSGQLSPPLKTLVNEVKEAIEQSHQPLRQLAQDMDADLGLLAEKNLIYLHQQIDYLQKALETRLETKHKRVIADFDQINLIFHPNKGLQERCWNVISLLNQHGIEWLTPLLNHSYQFSELHYLFTI